MPEPDYRRFPPEEYRLRFEKARRLLAESEFTGLLITEAGNYSYFSGGTGDFSYSRPHVLLLPLKGEPIACIQRFGEWSGPHELWFGDVRIYDTMTGAPLEMVTEAMRELGMDRGRVAAELGYEQRLGISPLDFARLKEALPGAAFVDGADIIWALRMIKSAEEITRHRRACRITSAAYDELFPGLESGISEREITGRFLALQAAQGGDAPWAYINSGPDNYHVTSGGPTGRRIEKGNLVWLDGGCLFRGYASDFCAAASVGPPTDEQRRLQELVAGITGRLVAAVRPGIRASDLDLLNRRLWEERGYDYGEINWAGGRIGHGLGTGNNLTIPPHIAAYDGTVLREGMVFTLEPGIVTGDGCFQAEADILVTAEGCEVLGGLAAGLSAISP